MDNRKLNTRQIIDAGILGIKAPDRRCPADAKLQRVGEDEISENILRAGLEAGGLTASMYYGCWDIWRTESGFSGELLQYRSVTDQFTDAPIEQALEKAVEWAAGCCG